MGLKARMSGAILGAAAIAACNGDGPTRPAAGCDDGNGRVVNLSPGEVYLGLTPETARCIELVQGSGRYVLAVLNTGTTPTAVTSYQIRGNGGALAAARVAAPRPLGNDALRASRLPHGTALARDIEHRIGHGDLLRRNLQLLRSVPRAGARRSLAAERPLIAANVDPNVGAISQVRLIDLDDETATLCSELDFQEINVRTVYSGQFAVVVEDVTAPLAGQMDAMYVEMGEEFEQDMWPILNQHFGNPLRLNPGGRLVMVFSPRVNDFERGVAGFVISCDFAPRSVVPASNEGEFFYAIVPTSAAMDFSGLTRPNWRRLMRSTLIHEVKHITSFAERINNGNPFEEAWLEEATAMIAEEIWARSVYNVQWKGNVTYQQSVFCDVRPQGFPQCAGRPLVMFSHFLLLSDYLEQPETLSPLGDPPGQMGASFYGSGWSFVRWAIDHYASSESGFLMPLTQGPQVGLNNVQARTGRPWPEMLGHWSLANAVDDRANFNPDVPLITHPSWNYRNMYQLLRQDLPQVFSRQYPLVPTQLTFGAFANTGTIAGGSASFYEISGAGVPTQVIELLGEAGGALPAQVRLAVVRVQ